MTSTISILIHFLRTSAAGRVAVIVLAAFLCLVPATALNAQLISDSLELGPIEVQATRVSQPIDRQPTRINLIDSTVLEWAGQQTLAEVLVEHSTANLKSYGPGGSATLSQRGMEADQTQIIWNGIPLNTPFLGLTDLSLIDSDMLSSIEVVPGNMSSAYGGRSIGGTVLLNTTLPDNRLTVSQGVGSYGYDRSLLKAGYSKGDWSAGIMGRRQQAVNDFKYQNPLNDEIQKRENNSTRSRQVLVGISREQSAGVDVKSMLWINESINEVPGAITARTASASQEDRSLRWLSTAETYLRDWRVEGKAYYSSYELDYLDNRSKINSHTLSREARLMLETRKHFSNTLVFNGIVSGGITGVETNNYSSTNTRRVVSIQANPLVKPNESWYLYPAVRYDYYSDYGGTVSPSLGVNWKPLPKWVFRINAGYNFSPPTFNDLYWSPGGNPDLRPERSKKIEAGGQWGEADAWHGKHTVSIYYLHLNNGIQWINSGGIWTPRNVRQMVSRGATWQYKKSFSVGDWEARWGQLLDWSRAEVTKAGAGSSEISGNQLAYVPLWKYKTNLTFSRDKFHVGAHYTWTGLRYTDNSHLSQLDPYLLINTTLGYRYPIGSFDLRGTLRIQNLTNSDYQMIQWYPMPGRNFQFTLSLEYKF